MKEESIQYNIIIFGVNLYDALIKNSIPIIPLR